MESTVSARLHVAERLETGGFFEMAISEYEQLADLAVEALDYYHKYDRRFLGMCIGITFFLWSLAAACTLLGSMKNTNLHPLGQFWDGFLRLIAIILTALIVTVLFFAPSWPFSHTVYQLAPMLLFLYLIGSPLRRSQLIYLVRHVKNIYCTPCVGSYSECHLARTAVLTAASIVLLELLIWGFHYRPLLCLACLGFSLWPLIDSSFGQDRPRLRLLWSLFCMVLSLFPLLPVIGASFVPLLGCVGGLISIPINLCGISWLTASSTSAAVFPTKSFSFRRNFTWSVSRTMGYLLTSFMAMSSCFVAAIHSELGSSSAIRAVIHCYSWSALVLPFLIMFTCFPARLGIRLLGCVDALLIPYILLSTGYEVIFFIVFVGTALVWLQLESPFPRSNEIWNMCTSTFCSEPKLQGLLPMVTTENLLSLKNFRQSLFFTFLLVISFFGTGNIASINSFDPRSVYCFATVLDVAVFAVFLAIKVIIPMLLLGIVYAAVQMVNTCEQTNNGFLVSRPVALSQIGIVVILSNVVAVHFFVWLRDEGSWLDIGQSISHYVIAMIIGFAAFLFTVVGQKLLSIRFASDVRRKSL